MDILGVIPARGNSQRLKNKNILPLKGRPLIFHAIDLSLKVCDATLITTDSDIIVDMVRQEFNHAVAIVKRPPHLAGPEASSVATWQHALNTYDTHNEFPLSVLLEPTCPLRTREDVTACIGAALVYGSACTVSKVKTPPQKFLQPTAEGFVDIVSARTDTQAYPTYYYRNGAAYASVTDDDLENTLKKAMPVLIDRPLVSIDTELDYRMCELLMERENNGTIH